MAAKINTIISARNYEAIRDRVGQIIADELVKQADLAAADTGTGNNIVKVYDETIKPDVYIERYSPMTTEEERIVNVYVRNNSFSEQTQLSQKAETIICIDVYVKAKQTTTEGYLNASKNLHRITGLIFAILQNPEYKTLAFDPGTIFSRNVSGIGYDKGFLADATFSRMSQITFNVTHIETSDPQATITAEGYDTAIKIGLTDKGYKIILNNDTD